MRSAAARPVAAPETLEDVRGVDRRKPAARVRHFDLRARCRRNRDGDPPADVRVTHRVVEEVIEQQPDFFLVVVDDAIARRCAIRFGAFARRARG